MSIEFSERMYSFAQTFTKCCTGRETGDITLRYVSTSPPDKLGCLDSVYGQYSLADLRKYLSNFKIAIRALNLGAGTDFELNFENFLIGLAEFYRVIDRSQSDVTPHQKEVMLRMITVIYQVYQNKFVDEINILGGLSLVLAIRDIAKADDDSLSRQEGNDKCITFVSAIKGCMSPYLLGTSQIYSLKFAKEFKRLLESLNLSVHEVGAGSGMLTAALKEVGFQIKSTTDICTYIESWPGVSVTENNALEVINENFHNSIFLIGAADDRMLDAIIQNAKETGHKFLVLLLGFEFNQMLSKEPDVIKRIQLNISDYFQILPCHGVQLLGFNYSRGEFGRIESSIPKAMQIEELHNKSKLLHT
ncbi:MAG: hypothetical protein HAW66_02190 [Shewanella sp.]|nr:hypothetical protein [Shewanella sp.]